MCNKSLFFIAFLISSVVYSKTEIKFNLISNQIYLNVKINNNPCVLLYDTGDNGFSLDSSYVEVNRLLIGNSRRIIDLKINDFKKTINGFNILDYQKYSRLRIQGIIGVDFFKDYIVEIDYFNYVLNLYNKQEVISSQYDLLISKHNLKSFSLYGFFFIPVNLAVNDTLNINGDFLFDTGSARNITLFNSSDSMKKSNDKVKVIRKNTSFYGFDESIYFKAKEVVFNNVKWNDILIDYTETNSLDFKKNNLTGVIGGGFLKAYNILIDYEKSEIYLRKNESNDTSINEMISDGFYLNKELESNKIVVSKVIEGGVFLNDIKIDDEILEIDSIKSEKIELKEIDKLKCTVGTKIEYKIKRGKKTFYIYTEVVKLL